MKERRNNRDPCASINRLFDNAGIARIDQVIAIISFVGAGKNENLSIAHEDRVKACARLPKKALFTDDATELFGSGVPSDHSC